MYTLEGEEEGGGQRRVKHLLQVLSFLQVAHACIGAVHCTYIFVCVCVSDLLEPNHSE